MAEAPLLVGIGEAARRLSVGRTLLYEMACDGRLGPRPVKLGRRTLVRADELTAWVAAGCPPRVKWLRDRTSGGPARG
ncbi:MAG: helix-turn-helix domain-containing protein [Phycisphaerae bacterium]|nr:helix-turn-helix domain-containing protein [Phycisphaerae bacterium]